MGPDQREEIIGVIRALQQELLESQSDQHRAAVERRIDRLWERIAH